MKRIILRDLPGVAWIEQQLLQRERLMKDELEELYHRIQEVSLRLFGITEQDTSYYCLPEADRPRTGDEWETHFEFLDYRYEEEQDFWDHFGINVQDEAGEELACIEVFGRQLVCAVKRIHPSASPAFAGGDKSDEQVRAEAEAWAARLLNPRH